jgi:hypothetical protein
MESIDIDIKILNDKYEIFLNKILYKSQIKNITTYIGKDIYENKKIIIDVYENNIQLIAKKIMNKIININHDNIINIIDIIIEKNITYIIKPYYKQFINNLEKSNQQNIITYFNQILSTVTYLYSKDIEFETITLEQLYIDDKKILISQYFENNSYPQNIVYGSPIYNLYNIKNKNNIEYKIVINIRNLFLDIINKINDISDIDLYDITIYLNNDKRNSLQNIIDYFKNYNLDNLDNRQNLKKTNKINKSDLIGSIFHCEL